MTAPATLPIIGKVKFKEVRKEKLLKFWEGVARKTKLKVRYGEQVETITRCEDAFQVRPWFVRNVLGFARHWHAAET